MAQKKAPICQATHKFQVWSKEKNAFRRGWSCTSTWFQFQNNFPRKRDPVHQMTQCIVLQHNWFGTSLCKGDKLQIFASIYPAQSVTVVFKKKDNLQEIWLVANSVSKHSAWPTNKTVQIDLHSKRKSIHTVKATFSRPCVFF